MRPKYLTERDGVWHFARRVPTVYASLDRRGVIKHSTGVPVAVDPHGTRAKALRDVFNSDLEASWRALAAGQPVDLERRFEETRRRARALGVGYLPAAELAVAPLEDILARLSLLRQRDATSDPVSQDAVLGIVKEPKFTLLLSQLYDEFESAVRAEIADYSPDQLRRFRHAKTRAIANLIAVIGDREISAIKRTDALAFRVWWQDRIIEEAMDPDTANKDIGNIVRMVKTVSRLNQVELGPVFADLRFEGGFENTKPPFTRDFVQDVILDSGRLMELNDQARHVVFVIAGTGMRIPEVVNLNRKTIFLAGRVPFVSVRPDGRRLKTSESFRDMPLTGVALEAMRLHPDGFPRYHDNNSTLSATVNKYMLDNGLRPTIEHTLTSLRHTFKDSLIEAEAPEHMIDALMGHALEGEKYGKGPSLALKLRWMEKVAFSAPKVM